MDNSEKEEIINDKSEDEKRELKNDSSEKETSEKGQFRNGNIWTRTILKNNTSKNWQTWKGKHLKKGNSEKGNS